MGNTSAKACGNIVLPEILTTRGGKVLLIHGSENGKNFWWPPGAYWLREKACNLSEEQPESWIRRVIQSQIGVEVLHSQLQSVEVLGPGHPPVLVYTVKLDERHSPAPMSGFDRAEYFDISDLPSELGRDDKHGSWLTGMLQKLVVTSQS